MGFFPPVRSTMAPKGIRNNEPLRAGLAASRPISKGLRAIDCFSLVTMGPKAETPAKPAKNAKVVQARAAPRLD
jgi:hypothetical protein